MHDIARGKVLTGRFVGAFRKLTDQLLKDDAHAKVADELGAQVGGGETLHHLIQQVGGFQLLDEIFKVEMLEDLASIFAECLHVAHQVGGGLGVGQSAKGQRRCVEELLASSTQQ